MDKLHSKSGSPSKGDSTTRLKVKEAAVDIEPYDAVETEEEADFLDDLSSNEFCNMDEHELTGDDRPKGAKLLDLTH